MQQWRTIKMKLSDLKPADYNPREITDRALDGLSQSIDKFGMVQPIVWNKRTGNIVGGHQRYKVLVEKGVADVDVVEVDLSEEEEVALNISLNNPAIQGEFSDKIEGILRAIKGGSDDLFSALRMDDLAETLRIALGEKGKTHPDAVPPMPDESACDSEVGKIYALGRHRLLCGDSTVAANVKALVEGEVVDMLITDPPYNVDYKGGTGLKIMNDAMSEDKFIEFLTGAFKAADEVMKPGAAYYVWYAGGREFGFLMGCRNVGWKLHQVLIWVKDRLVLGRTDYHYKHEPCLYGWKDCHCADANSYSMDHQPIAYGWKEGQAHDWLSDRKQTTILEHPRPVASKEHPTMKPEAIFEYLISNNTKTGQNVLDVFCGSGTTVIACERMDRKAFVCELSRQYADVIRRRWAEFVYGDGCDWRGLTPEIG